VHFAAKYGHLDKIPPEFLTKESVTVYDKYGETPLHTAAYHKHADQIHAKFLTLEFLGIHTKHHTAWTVLYLMAFSGQLKLLPAPIIEKYNSMSRLEKGGLDYDMPKRHELEGNPKQLFILSLVFSIESRSGPHFTIGRAKKSGQ